MKKNMKVMLIVAIASVLLQACSSVGGGALRHGRSAFQNQDYRTAFKDLLPLAQKGNSQAQYAIGYMYYNGLGVAKDFQMAQFWLHKSAAQQYQKAKDALKMIVSAKSAEPFPAPHSLYAMHQAQRSSIA